MLFEHMFIICVKIQIYVYVGFIATCVSLNDYKGVVSRALHVAVQQYACTSKIYQNGPLKNVQSLFNPVCILAFHALYYITATIQSIIIITLKPTDSVSMCTCVWAVTLLDAQPKLLYTLGKVTEQMSVNKELGK